MSVDVLEVNNFLSYTIGIIVFFAGMALNERIAFLRAYNIPEPVTGGILAALIGLAIYLTINVEIEFAMDARNILLVYFFTSIGINARLSDLLSGGRPLILLLMLTLFYMVIQNVIGVGVVSAAGYPAALGILGGSASLIGGHGTAIAWSPQIAEQFDIPNAVEIGIASATLGLVFASLLGGPLAKILLANQNIQDAKPSTLLVGISHQNEKSTQINHISIMAAILVLHIAIILGYLLNQVVGQMGLKLPLFVSCMLVAIILSNLQPHLFPKVRWPARTNALALVSDFSLGLFIAMSLMGMQLWAMIELAGPLILLLVAQVLGVILFIRFVLFPVMGRDYLSVVLSAGFAGFALGATPTAVANMSAVTKTHGPAPMAFIILPLIGAFFADLSNAVIIQTALSLLGG